MKHTIVWLHNLCFRMAGVFDIDLENEDISDTEVCIADTPTKLNFKFLGLLK